MVPRDERGAGAECERAGEVHRVIAAQPVLLRELARPPCEGLVDPDAQQLAVRGLEVLECAVIAAGLQAPAAPRRCERGAAFGIGQDAGGCAVRRRPELGGQIGAVLDDDELDKR